MIRENPTPAEGETGNPFVVYTLRILAIMSPLFLVMSILALEMDGSTKLFLSFFVPFLICLLSALPYRLSLEGGPEMDLKTALIFSAFVWLVLSVIGAVPYWISGTYSILDGWFESMSGFTATGLTMATRPEELPRSILLWRSMTEWIGGVGVIVLFLALMTRTSKVLQHLYVAEARTDKIVPSIVGTAKRIWTIYVMYTILATLVYWILGMRLFDSVNHAMTTLATGGFSTSSASFAPYGTAIRIAGVVFMYIGAISFASHYHLFKGRLKGFFTVEVRALILAGIVATLLAITVGPVDALFQSVSALTGTGFSTADIASWSDYHKMILTILMIFGGGYGSTSSALKMIRVLILLYGILWYVRVRQHPSRMIIPFRFGGRNYEPSEVRDVAIFVTSYILVLMLGALAFMAAGYDAMDSLFEVASAEGNVGLSVGITGPALSPPLKLVLILEMWAGRLEIFPVLMMLREIPSLFKRFRRGPVAAP